MTITKKEFKEIVKLYKDAWDKWHEYSKLFNEEFLEELMFPTLDWLDSKLTGCGLILDLRSGIGAFHYIDENGEEQYTKDPDLIYDLWVQNYQEGE